MKIRIGVALILGLVILRASSAPVGILVPAYFYPTTDGLYLWPKLNVAAGQVPITAIMNPASGPGVALDTNYRAVVTNLTNAGGKVIGYVHTRYSTASSDLRLRSLDVVRAEVNQYVTWYGNAGLTGIFADEMRADSGTALVTVVGANGLPETTSLTVGDYYRALYLHITSKGPAYRVIGNPGASGGGIEVYLQSPRAADTLVTFEDKTGYEANTVPSWVSNYAASNFANIPYNIPSADTMDNYVRLARSRNVGYIYVTDDIYTGPFLNPWDQLPSYWEQQVELVKSINDATLETRVSLSKPPNQAASLFVSGNPGTYQIQASDNLCDWLTVNTTVSASGGFIWIDPESSSRTRRFYRTTK